MVCYVDDCTYSTGSTDPEELSEKLSSQYKIISDYMAANNLVINADKTHLVVMGSRKTASRRHEVSLQAGEHVIEHTRTEKLLGANICEDLTLGHNCHIRQFCKVSVELQTLAVLRTHFRCG